MRDCSRSDFIYVTNDGRLIEVRLCVEIDPFDRSITAYELEFLEAGSDHLGGRESGRENLPDS